MKRIYVILSAVVLLGGFFWFSHYRHQPTLASAQNEPIVQISVPQALSPQAKIGEELFKTSCAVCHGTNAVGKQGLAPPLVHKIYEPSHHGDAAFQAAVAFGVRQHHWPFGDMPAVEGLTKQQIDYIIAYVRALQRENGIF